MLLEACDRQGRFMRSGRPEGPPAVTAFPTKTTTGRAEGELLRVGRQTIEGAKWVGGRRGPWLSRGEVGESGFAAQNMKAIGG